MYEIESGIEIPKTKTHSRNRVYPFLEMKVGDSFFVEIETAEKRRSKQVSICGSAGRLRPKKFVTRVVEDGVRCWRVK